MNVTTKSITDDKVSILIDQLTFKLPEFNQVVTIKLFSYPLANTW